MKQFIRKILFFGIPLIAILVIVFVIDNPFIIFHNYEDIVNPESKRKCVNGAYMGVKLMDMYDDSLNYNSFIVGNSRALQFRVEDWKTYVGDEASCFIFFQSAGNLLGLYQRTKYLYERFDTIKNLLLVVDVSPLGELSKRKGHLFVEPWQVTGVYDVLTFYSQFFEAYYSLDYILYGVSMEKTTQIKKQVNYLTHELYWGDADSLIDNTKDEYYTKYLGGKKIFYDRPSIEKISEQQLYQDQIKVLKHINALAKERGTDLRLVVGPLYDQEKLNPKDYQTLCDIFGEDCITDFSGINEYTNDISNYYEISHYRPKLCKIVLDSVYSK